MPETVKAKFRVCTRTDDYGSNSIVLKPVVGGNEENERFYQATPGGEINLNCTNKETAQFFELGEEYYVEFIKTPNPEN